MNNIEIARVAHEVNRAYCMSIGDCSQAPWEDAPQWQKDSAINGVKFHRLNPQADPASSHANWLKQKEADGWKCGPAKDVEKKEHPCCVPYDQLPTEQKAKDFLFRAVIHALDPATAQRAGVVENPTQGQAFPPIIKFFEYSHLPAHLQATSAPLCHLAKELCIELPVCAETTAGLRKLLEAKDCFVRARLER